MPPTRTSLAGTAAGVPFLAVPPRTPSTASPLVVAWHLMDPPRTEAAFAAALPLHGLDAWRVYLGLPLCGSRLPAGGFEELMQLGYQDAVLNLQEPVVTRGAQEFPGALAELRQRFGLGAGPLGLVGGSIGAAVAQLVLIEAAPAAGVPVHSAVLVSPLSRLRPTVDALGRRFGVDYPWSERSLQAASRLDFAARAQEFARAGQPAVRLLVGSDDDREGFLEPAQQLRAALAGAYDRHEDVDLVVVPDMAHALAEEPGDEPAAQIPAAAVVDQHAVHWLTTHLGTSGDGT